MKPSKPHTVLAVVLVVGLSAVFLRQYHSQNNLRAEIQRLHQENENLRNENERLSQPASPAGTSNLRDESPSAELLRLRGEVGMLRLQAEELKASHAGVQNMRQQAKRPPEQKLPDADQYPNTPEAATASIFETLMQGDLAKFVANFGEPGVPQELYDKMFNQKLAKEYFAQIDSVSLGQPTNSFGPNMWFIPYKLHFKDGHEKELQLHVAQDPQSQKWYFKGGI